MDRTTWSELIYTIAFSTKQEAVMDAKEITGGRGTGREKNYLSSLILSQLQFGFVGFTVTFCLSLREDNKLLEPRHQIYFLLPITFPSPHTVQGIEQAFKK